MCSFPLRMGAGAEVAHREKDRTWVRVVQVVGGWVMVGGRQSRQGVSGIGEVCVEGHS